MIGERRQGHGPSVAPTPVGARVVTADGIDLWSTSAGPQSEATPWWLLGAISLLALLLRTIQLDSGLWYDEIRTLQDSVRSPLLRILTVFPGDNQHTFFSLLAHGSMALFGDHIWSLRLPSALLGAASVPMLFFLAREFTGRAEALLASLLLSVSYHHIWFSQSARGYATLGFLTLLSSWLLLRGLRRGRVAYFLWYAVAVSLGVYTHVTMVFLVASHAALCVLPLGLPLPTRAQWLRWKLPMTGFALAGLLSLLLYAPFLLEVKQRVVTKPSPVLNANSRWALMELLRGLQIGLGSMIAVSAGAALFLAGMWSYLKQSRFILGLFLLPGVFTIGAAVVLHRPVRPRFVLFLIGFALLIVVRGALHIGQWLQRRALAARTADAPTADAKGGEAKGGDAHQSSGATRLGSAPTSRLGVALALLLVVLSAGSLPVLWRYPKQDFVGAMQFVDAQRAEREPVVTAGPATYPYASYFHRDWTGIHSLGDLQRVRAGGTRVWVLYTLASYIESEAPDLMATLNTECDVRQRFRGTLGGGDVTVCALRAPPPTP